MLYLLPVLCAFASLQTPVAQRSIIPVEAAPSGLGRIVDVEGPWMATLRRLPIPERERRYHAPRAPWELARVSVEGLERVVLASSEVKLSGWGAPQFAAVGADGALIAAWRLGAKIALVSPAGTRSDLTLELPSGWECAHVEHDGVIHRKSLDGGTQRFALTWRNFDAQGVGEPFDLGVTQQRHGTSLRVLREGDRIVWIRGADELACFDVSKRELAVVACAGIEHFDLDDVHGGVVFAYSYRMDRTEHGASNLLRTIDLASGGVLEQPCAFPIIAFTPKGWLSSTHWFDAIAGERVELERPVVTYQRHFQVGAGELWFDQYQKADRVVLRPEVRPVLDADNRAPALAIERLLDGGTDDASMRSHLGALQRPYSNACVALIARVAREWSDMDHRQRALRLLGASDHSRASEILRELLVVEPKWWERMTAISALSRLGDPSSAEAIVAALPMDEVDGDQADRVALALAILGDISVLPVLDGLFERTRSPKVDAARHWLRQREAFLGRLQTCRSLLGR